MTTNGDAFRRVARPLKLHGVFEDGVHENVMTLNAISRVRGKEL